MIRARRILILAGAVLASVVGSAHATTYCVNAPSCVGTTQPSISAAIGAANVAADADVIEVGAGTYAQSAPLALMGGRPVTLRGAGAASTRITFSDAVLTGLSVSDSASVLENVSVSAPRTITAVYLSAGTIRNASISGMFATDGSLNVTGGTVQDTTVTSSDYVPIILATGAGKVTALKRVQALGAQKASTDTAIGNSIGAYLGGTTVITNSYARGSIDLSFGNSTAATTLQLADTVIDAPHALRAVGIATADSNYTTSMDLRNLTINSSATNSPTETAPVGIDISAKPNSGVALTVGITGVAMRGVFSNAIVAASTGTSSLTTTVTDSVLPWSTAIATGNGVLTKGAGVVDADPGFVDAAAGDFRPRAGSPLVDAGPTTLAAFQSGLDQRGAARTVNGRTDIGAIEYARATPAAAVTSVAPASAKGGSTITVAASGTDADPGETASLTYAWGLPGGATATGSTATFVAPDAPGTYEVRVRVQDAAGASSEATASFVVPVERVAPKLTLLPKATTRTAVLKRTPVTVTVTTNERASVKATAVATVTIPPARRGLAAKRVAVTLGAATLPIGGGSRAVTFTPTKLAAAKLALLLKAKGATLSIRITGTATDASRNVGTALPKAVAVAQK